VIRALLKECVEGVSDREREALELAEEWGIAESWVTKSFAEARAAGLVARGAEIAARLDGGAVESPKPSVKASSGAELKVKRRKITNAELEAAAAQEAGFAEALSAAITKGEPKPKADEPEAAAAGRIMLPAVVPPPPPLQPPKSDWDEAVAAMNGQHAIIENVGGKTVIARKLSLFSC
jgi:hypothetical protein